MDALVRNWKLGGLWLMKIGDAGTTPSAAMEWLRRTGTRPIRDGRAGAPTPPAIFSKAESDWRLLAFCQGVRPPKVAVTVEHTRPLCFRRAQTRLGAKRAQFPGESCADVVSPTRDDDSGAFASECPRGRETDAGRAGSDEDTQSADREIHVHLSWKRSESRNRRPLARLGRERSRGMDSNSALGL
jgi:hypothetical protein